VIAAVLLAAALSPPATSSGHELTAAVGLGTRAPIMVVSWTGRRRWGAWLRLDQPDGKPAGQEAYPNSTQVYTTAFSMGVAWRALPRLAVGVGYGEKKEDITVYGPSGAVREDEDDEHGMAAIGTWTFPVKDTLGVAVSASAGPSGFGAAVGVTFSFP
jgi:hypothetical protein